MVTHSSSLSRKFPLTEKTGGLQSMGKQRVRHNGASEPACIYRDRLRGGVDLRNWLRKL